jgi:hypothetical protein
MNLDKMAEPDMSFGKAILEFLFMTFRSSSKWFLVPNIFSGSSGNEGIQELQDGDNATATTTVALKPVLLKE